MRTFLCNIAALAALSLTQLPSSAQFIQVTVGAIELQANQSGQVVDLFVENTNPTALTSLGGLNFALQIGDGTSGPVIEGINLGAGSSVFAGGTQTDQGSDSWHAFFGIDVGTPVSLPASSSTLLARVTFSTVGLSASSQSWALSLNNVGGNDPVLNATHYVTEPGNNSRTLDSIVNGTLTVVPEPAAYATAMGLLALGLAFCRRFARMTVS